MSTTRRPPIVVLECQVCGACQRGGEVADPHTCGDARLATMHIPDEFWRLAELGRLAISYREAELASVVAWGNTIFSTATEVTQQWKQALRDAHTAGERVTRAKDALFAAIDRHAKEPDHG